MKHCTRLKPGRGQTGGKAVPLPRWRHYLYSIFKSLSEGPNQQQYDTEERWTGLSPTLLYGDSKISSSYIKEMILDNIISSNTRGEMLLILYRNMYNLYSYIQIYTQAYNFIYTRNISIWWRPQIERRF